MNAAEINPSIHFQNKNPATLLGSNIVSKGLNSPCKQQWVNAAGKERS